MKNLSDKKQDIHISEDEFQRFRGYIHDECGIELSDQKQYLVEARLSSLLGDYNCRDFSDLYFKAKNGFPPKLKDSIINAITTNETLWFRDSDVWEAIKEEVLPAYIERVKKNPQETVTIWSAGCSTGQEPYSMAMLINELAAKKGVSLQDNFSILGTDVSEESVLLAQQGRYTSISMSRGLSRTYKVKYFRKQGAHWQIDLRIRKAVDFNTFNLLDYFGDIGTFDIVLCRNVIMYLSREVKQELLTNVLSSIKPGGYFFIGNTESMRFYFENKKNVLEPLDVPGGFRLTNGKEGL